MCDPVTITLAGIAIASIGTAGYGAHQQSSAQKESAKFQSQVAKNNRIIAQRQAEDRMAQGKQEERNYRTKLEQIKGQQRANFAGAGVVVDSDTPFDILGETAYYGEIDALTIRNNAEREAYGFKVESMNLESQASLYSAQSKNINPTLNTFSTALSSASSSAGSIASSYRAGQKPDTSMSSSDERLKTDIKKVGESKSGINIYEFKYKNYPQHIFRGVIAQEIQKIKPEAVVIGNDGFLSVIYSLLDVKFEQVK